MEQRSLSKSFRTKVGLCHCWKICQHRLQHCGSQTRKW